MSINVYWSSLERECLRAEEPEPLSKRLSSLYAEKESLRCPAFKDYYNNVYALKSLYSYSFNIKDGEVVSDKYDQAFFNEHVFIRDLDKKSFSFFNRYIFFTDEKSLKVSVEPPQGEDNFVANNCLIFPAVFDVGKWYRNTEFSFILKNNITNFEIKEQDVFYYLRFHTDKKINFIRFIENEKLYQYRQIMLNSKDYKKKTSSMDYYYSIFNLKRNILKNIKDNVVR
jgi:hypothetical protein